MSGDLIDQQASGTSMDSLNPNSGEPLAGFEHLTIVHELTDELKEQLVARSTDDDDASVQRNTSDRNRFGSIEKLDNWLSKGREINLFVDQQGNLAGIFWSGEERMPDFDGEAYQELSAESVRQITVAVRLYPPHRGQGDGLAAAIFINSVNSLFVGRDEATVAWAETTLDNTRMTEIERQAGMEQVGINPNNGRGLFAIANFETEAESSEADDVVGQA